MPRLTSDPPASRSLEARLRDGEESALEECLQTLFTADDGDRSQCASALAKYRGTVGLVSALREVARPETTLPDPDTGRNWGFQSHLFDLIDTLNDPRGADALASYIDSKPHHHFETRAALSLAALGDLRAIEPLAKRMGLFPPEVYRSARDWEAPLRSDDQIREHAARMLGELAWFHPEARDRLREGSEKALLAWINDRPSPPANGMQALAAMGSTKALSGLRGWANPRVPLPRKGTLPPMPVEWVIAETALRYEGLERDEQAWPVLARMLKRRPANVDVTMAGLFHGGVAILGMTLRAVGVGAADGFSEWGDRRAVAPLLDYLSDPFNNEQARIAAASALGWVAQAADLPVIIAALGRLPAGTAAADFQRFCVFEALSQRPHVFSARDLMPLLSERAPTHLVQLRGETTALTEPSIQIARALAKSGVDPTTEAELVRLLEDPGLRDAAALALLLGGKPDAATRALQAYATSADRLSRLARLWYDSLNFWSQADLDAGLVYRYVDNARTLADVVIANQRQTWARGLLKTRLGQIRLDNGPHSITRDRLRLALWNQALAGDPQRSAAALRTLALLGERGMLAALAARPIPGALAREIADENVDAEPAPEDRDWMRNVWRFNAEQAALPL